MDPCRPLRCESRPCPAWCESAFRWSEAAAPCLWSWISLAAEAREACLFVHQVRYMNIEHHLSDIADLEKKRLFTQREGSQERAIEARRLVPVEAFLRCAACVTLLQGFRALPLLPAAPRLHLVWSNSKRRSACALLARQRLGFHASLPNPIASGGDVEADAMEFLKRKGCIPLPAKDWSYQFAGASPVFNRDVQTYSLKAPNMNA